MIRRILLLTTLALAACDLPTDSAAPVPGNPLVQRQVWERQGIDDYRFTYSRDCFCPPMEAVRVEVRNGQVFDVREVQSGRLVDQEEWRWIPTVDKLFDQIEDVMAADDYVEVKYHPTLGYPADVTLGTPANDAGSRQLISDLRRVN